MRPLPSAPVYLPEEITTHDGLLLIPNSQPIAHIAFLKPFSVLTIEQVEAVKNRKAFVYAYGFVEYRDVFDEKVIHETRFCYVYNFPQPGEPLFLKGLMPGGPEAYNRVTYQSATIQMVTLTLNLRLDTAPLSFYPCSLP